ncbi:uncharacterized protein CANTADRAFT_4111 [Suhomyces tanzawaensis NRRL Y-17324]|uniref:Protein YAE1 n=1 Tax=Suhomyces tanzawaensis NRRL Y-17324 TaxID=984487 RepID=A0A1E4SRE3_9ASCO|nr:uncharacterized protein CANTADRAFT_4111 [Suhomyces tanzawaensis NRRL Y-17324]ODV82071.1 hypothetical protein CANTADRAFT_4111 [Suhomyces tanzawaensis NRRL Y-17324]
MACGCTEPAVEAEDRLAASDLDDIWGDDEVLASSNADIKRSHHKQGYLDGKTQANEANLQHGFDMAFPQGARLGMVVGQLLAKAMATGNSELFQEAQRELHIERVLSKKYFNDELEMAEGHEILEKWQKRLQ